MSSPHKETIIFDSHGPRAARTGRGPPACDTPKELMDAAPEDTRSTFLGEPGSPGAARVVAIWDGGSAAAVLPRMGTLTIGRGLSCGLRVPVDSVSREHCRIHAGPPAMIEDLGSANGTLVGGAKLPAGQRLGLHPGHFIQIGKVWLVLQLAHDPEGASPGVAPERAGAEAMERLHQVADLVAVGDLNVILQGETGAGKEVLAERIHQRSARAARAFVRINCAAFAPSMVEAELFGHEKGAFTGATQAKVGLLESAHLGSVLLDEVAELPPAVQAKLLRAVGNGEIWRVGATSCRRIDVRYLAATHEPFERLIEQGRFRADLYFRLNGMTLNVPPLRERRAEILPLANQFLHEAAARHGRAPAALTQAAEAQLLSYPWPGNVRELRNVVERAFWLSDGRPISTLPLAPPPERVPVQTGPSSAPPVPPQAAVTASLPDAVAEVERQRIVDALDRCGGNQTRAAQALGISRRTLLNRLDRYSLPRPRREGSDEGREE